MLRNKPLQSKYVSEKIKWNTHCCFSPTGFAQPSIHFDNTSLSMDRRWKEPPDRIRRSVLLRSAKPSVSIFLARHTHLKGAFTRTQNQRNVSVWRCLYFRHQNQLSCRLSGPENSLGKHHTMTSQSEFSSLQFAVHQAAILTCNRLYYQIPYVQWQRQRPSDLLQESRQGNVSCEITFARR